MVLILPTFKQSDDAAPDASPVGKQTRCIVDLDGAGDRRDKHLASASQPDEVATDDDIKSEVIMMKV